MKICPSNKPEKSKAGRPKSNQKAEQILLAANSLFLSQGVSATSMDALANAAGVSKQTVYSHFKNKEVLFTAVIERKLQDYQFDKGLLSANQSPEIALTKVAEQLVSLYLDEQVIAMYRVVIGEINTAPQIPKLFFEAGPNRTKQLICNYILEHVNTNISQESAFQHTAHFLNMLKGEYHMKSILGLDYSISSEQKSLLVKQAVSLLLDNVR
jgi:TetR/AcrR family transcriptional repressor of mexJK operon